MSEAINIGTIDDIDEGEAKVIPAEENGTGEDIAVFHAEDGNFYALDDTCTHETASLADGWIEGTEVECPVHSAKFCLKSGTALCMPATIAARTHKVEVSGNDVLLYPAVSVVDA
ncbi:bifunctional 3-phenylpropionate/cinnamic acid dioxygenase ferredoxin subunit [Paeniglutamicibacter sp. ZC-3]|uniref:bifunctional 3-phenylpropionate/cinnamic acid dioxygenase ferredoxin subunit n=1 Tax=Paeniglutamicibacter TaxID=1742990 RepID=UPI0021F74231|nr:MULTISPECIES: bifunctional 3-phenylpropionate/cinnamic acid dioxygenase ferredoxin subunit [Paeniglutamicibacter]MCV9994831.1 bifunctional 3-phenylpropionate/cinnamic acid dioxygenase ferredoxin subunit [Paeniglutamicibacter sp. ZC-3]MDO2934966.1 bifunctional 3-phenylpropionate/cinnamic acid dioxygenase ferredoxin subunit [Paeniglutamicibacter sulfureus]